MNNRDSLLKNIFSLLEKEGISKEELVNIDFNLITIEHLTYLLGELSKILVEYSSKDALLREELTKELKNTIGSLFQNMLKVDQALLKRSEIEDQKNAENLLS